MVLDRYGMRRRNRAKYGGRWQDTINPYDPPALPGETLAQWQLRTSRTPGWAPYCLACSTSGRMTWKPYGWICRGVGDPFGRRGCRNRIGRDFQRLPDSSGPDPQARDYQRIAMELWAARAMLEPGRRIVAHPNMGKTC